MSARRIGASGSSGSDSEPAWPTPMAVHNRTSSTAQALRKDWPTPSSPIFGNQPNANTTQWGGKNTLASFAAAGDHAARLWPTPDAAVGNDGESPAIWRARQAAWKAEYDSRAAGETKAGNGAGLPLTIAAKEWATPRASEGQHGGPAGRDTSGSLHLSAQSTQRATPTTQDSENDGPPSAFSRRTLPLNAQATGPRDPTTPKDGEPTSSDTRVLNPRFVEALMGFPTGWTDCALSETPSSRRRRAQLSEFLRSATAPMPSPATRWPLKWV